MFGAVYKIFAFFGSLGDSLGGSLGSLPAGVGAGLLLLLLLLLPKVPKSLTTTTEELGLMILVGNYTVRRVNLLKTLINLMINSVSTWILSPI